MKKLEFKTSCPAQPAYRLSRLPVERLEGSNSQSKELGLRIPLRSSKNQQLRGVRRESKSLDITPNP